MKIKLVKPFAQVGRVIPAGTILSDAPEAFMKRLVREGKAVLYPSPAVDHISDPAELKTRKDRRRKD